MERENTIVSSSANDTTDIKFCNVGTEVVYWMWCILAPIIVIGGLTSNLVILLVFRYPRFVKTSTMLNMFILALTDSLFLTTGPVLYWAIFVLDYDLLTISEVGCKLGRFLMHVTQDFSSWILVSLTYERVISVIKPLQVRELLTVRKAVNRLFVTFVILCGINMHFFFTNGLVSVKVNRLSEGTGDVRCDALTEEYKYYNAYVFVWIDMSALSLVPFVIMAISNAYIVSVLKESISIFPFDPSQITTSNYTSQSEGSAYHPSVKQPTSPSVAKQKYPRWISIKKIWQTRLPCKRFTGKLEPKNTAQSQTKQTQTPVSDVNPSSMTKVKQRREMGKPEPNKLSVVLSQSQTVQTSTSTVDANSSTMTKAKQRRENISLEVTQTLLLVSTVFLILTLPNTIYFIAYAFLYDEQISCTRTNTIMHIIWASTTLLSYVESGINLYLYSARSRRFREEVGFLLHIIGYRIRRVEPSAQSRSRFTRQRVL